MTGTRVPEPATDGVARLTWLLLAATGVGFLPWFAISALGPVLIQAFDASAVLPGRLVGVLFLTAAVASAVLGPVMARIGAARTVAAAFVVGAASMAGMAVAPSVLALTAVVAVAGLALAVPLPATAALVAQRVPVSGRGRVIGLAQSGQQVGALTAGFALPAIAAATSWRWSFAAAALVATALAVVAIGPARRDVAPGRHRGVERAPVWLLIYAMLMSSWTVSSVAFLPTFGALEHGFSTTAAGGLVTVIGAFAIVGKIAWGRLAGAVSQAAIPPIALALGTGVAVTIVASSTLIGAWTVWLGAAALGLTALGWPVVTLALVARQWSPSAAGKVSGQVLAGGFTGSAVGPMLFGWLLDVSSFTLAWWSGVGVAVAAAGLVWIVHLSAFALSTSRTVSSTQPPGGHRHE